MAPVYASLVTCSFSGLVRCPNTMCFARNHLFFSHRAILHVMLACNCEFIAALICFWLNIFLDLKVTEFVLGARKVSYLSAVCFPAHTFTEVSQTFFLS